MTKIKAFKKEGLKEEERKKKKEAAHINFVPQLSFYICEMGTKSRRENKK